LDNNNNNNQNIIKTTRTTTNMDPFSSDLFNVFNESSNAPKKRKAIDELASEAQKEKDEARQVKKTKNEFIGLE